MALDKFIAAREVADRIGLSRTTLHRMVKAGSFPPPVQMGQRAVRWREREIAEWLESKERS